MLLLIAISFQVLLRISLFNDLIAVEVIIEEFSLPEEIAAVTLIAFGSSTPEILLNTISAVKEASSLSMPALLGSGWFMFITHIPC